MEKSIFPYLNSLKEHEHACHIYENDSECYEIASNYFIHAIKCRETCVFISDRAAPEQLINRLEGHGIIHGKNAGKRAFEEIIIDKHLIQPLRTDALLAYIENRIDKVLEKGSKPLRILMMIKSDPFFVLTDSEKLWIKAYLNKICLEKPIAMMTQFNIEKISSRDLLSIFKTHPTIVEKGQVYKSPLYTDPGKIIMGREKEIDKLKILSSKEKKILSLITNGLSNSGVARELSISIKTVETHRANIMKKLDIHNLVDLVKFSMRNGIA